MIRVVHILTRTNVGGPSVIVSSLMDGLDSRVFQQALLRGEIGNGFGPRHNRLGVRRLEIGARALGYARRCMDLMLPYAQERVTFGKPLADRQAVQWWIADSFQEMEMVRLITWRLACKIDAGEDNWRRDAAMVKLQGTEMITRVVDRAMQMFGGMGMTKDMPLEYMCRACRVWRIYEGPSEVHR